MNDEQSILKVSQLPLLHCNVDAKVLDFNAAAVRLFGGLEGLVEYIGTPHFQHIFRQLAVSGDTYIEGIHQGGKNYDLIVTPYTCLKGNTEFSVLCKTTDAWERWVEGDHNILSLTQEVIDCIADGIIVVDAAGYVRQTNHSYELMVGIKKEEYENQHVQSLLETGYTHSSLTPMVVERDQEVTIVDVRNDKDLLLTGVPIRNNQSKIVGVICNVRDVSELQQLKRKLDESKKNERMYLERLNKFSKEQEKNQIITRNKKMQQLFDLSLKVASIDSTILVSGESGVGKGLLADIIHAHSKRSEQPFITLNCGAIPESLIESELFGYDAGAFTGASKGGKEGIFELANHGTIFLDEIGELPLNMQVKVLQTIQDGTVRRIGGKKSLKLDIRIIAATNRDLKAMVAEKTFREDLYYRLNVIPLHLPPLRDRREDVIPLSMLFLERFNEKYSLNKRFNTAVMKNFLAYQWPGNIRELENVVERLVVTSGEEEITITDFLEIEGMLGIEALPLKKTLEETEKNILEETYKRTRSSRKSAAVLGISQSAFVKKAQKYGIALTKTEIAPQK